MYRSVNLLAIPFFSHYTNHFLLRIFRESFVEFTFCANIPLSIVTQIFNILSTNCMAFLRVRVSLNPCVIVIKKESLKCDHVHFKYFIGKGKKMNFVHFDKDTARIGLQLKNMKYQQKSLKCVHVP